MSKVTNRYSNQDLIDKIYIWCSDYNRIPTQRDILSDYRMPTHHTYINRFGSIKKSIEEAKLDKMVEIQSIHEVIRELIDDNKHGFTIEDEYVKINDIVVDFKLIDRDGNTHYMDLVFLKNVDPQIIKWIHTYRSIQMDKEDYVIVSSIEDLAKALYVGR